MALLWKHPQKKVNLVLQYRVVPTENLTKQLEL